MQLLFSFEVTIAEFVNQVHLQAMPGASTEINRAVPGEVLVVSNWSPASHI